MRSLCIGGGGGGGREGARGSERGEEEEEGRKWADLSFAVTSTPSRTVRVGHQNIT